MISSMSSQAGVAVLACASGRRGGVPGSAHLHLGHPRVRPGFVAARGEVQGGFQHRAALRLEGRGIGAGQLGELVEIEGQAGRHGVGFLHEHGCRANDTSRARNEGARGFPGGLRPVAAS
jgi:hypothetical protein